MCLPNPQEAEFSISDTEFPTGKPNIDIPPNHKKQMPPSGKSTEGDFLGLHEKRSYRTQNSTGSRGGSSDLSMQLHCQEH